MKLKLIDFIANGFGSKYVSTWLTFFHSYLSGSSQKKRALYVVIEGKDVLVHAMKAYGGTQL
jgi:hypothetical protein